MAPAHYRSDFDLMELFQVTFDAVHVGFDAVHVGCDTVHVGHESFERDNG